MPSATKRREVLSPVSLIADPIAVSVLSLANREPMSLSRLTLEIGRRWRPTLDLCESLLAIGALREIGGEYVTDMQQIVSLMPYSTAGSS